MTSRATVLKHILSEVVSHHRFVLNRNFVRSLSDSPRDAAFSMFTVGYFLSLNFDGDWLHALRNVLYNTELILS